MGWEKVPLQEIAEINPKSKKNSIPEKLDVSFIPMRCVEELSGRIDLSITKKYQQVKKGYTYFEDDDVLFAKITPCMENGKIAIAKNLKNKIGFGSTEFHVIRLKDSEISRKFYFYHLIQNDFRNKAQRKMKGTAGQLRVSTDYMKEIFVPVPPLNEQKRIVEKIEELFSKLDNCEELLEKTKSQLKHYRKSFLNSIFNSKLPENWQEKEVKEVSEVITGSTPSKKKPEYYGGNVPFFKPTDLNAGYYVKNSTDHLSEEGLKNARFLPEKTTLVTCIGATIGKTGFIRIPGTSNQQINAMVPNTEIIYPEFLYFLFISPKMFRMIKVKSSSTTLPILNKTKFETLTIPVPSLEQQKRIVEDAEAKFSIIESLENLVEYKIDNVTKLRNSIFKQAFEGKLVPQDPNDEPASELLKRIKASK